MIEVARLTQAERRAAWEARCRDVYTPQVPGVPGDGSPVVLHTDADRGLVYTWVDRSPDVSDAGPRESGIETSLLTVTRQGARVGHLRVSFTNKAIMAATFARPLHYAEENRGWSLGIRLARNGWREEPTPAEVWAAAHRHARCTPASVQARGEWLASWNITADLAPATDAVIEADLAVIEQDLAREMRGFTRWHSTPYVAYSSVDPGLRGTGIGRQMYLLTARHLATTGRVLRGSGMQSPEAQALWARLVADPTAPTRRTTATDYRSGAKKRYWALDYRGH